MQELSRYRIISFAVTFADELGRCDEKRLLG
jgi:hypothetical protein